MKLCLTMALTLMFFSGCNSRTQNARLLNTNAELSLSIQQHRAQIEELQKKVERITKSSILLMAASKDIELKEVKDNNYSVDYMYPGEQKPKNIRAKLSPAKKAPVVTHAREEPELKTAGTNESVEKTECIAMIGQTKFDKYTQMFASEAAAIKRCNILKSMK